MAAEKEIDRLAVLVCEEEREVGSAVSLNGRLVGGQDVRQTVGTQDLARVEGENQPRDKALAVTYEITGTAVESQGAASEKSMGGLLHGKEALQDLRLVDSICIELSGDGRTRDVMVAEDESSSMEESDDSAEGSGMELPQVAGNLSPRFVFRRETSPNTSLVELNVDPLVEEVKSGKRRKGKGLRARFKSDRQLRSLNTNISSSQHGVQFVAISEPKLDASRLESIRLKLSFDYALVNESEDLWIFYSSPFVCSVVGSSSQHISLHIHHPWLPRPMVFSFVHALCSVEGRRGLWEKLLSDKPSSLPWFIGGDFNVIVGANEKRGGRPFSVSEGLEFLAFMEEAEVFDVGFSGQSFTWCNNRRGRARIWKRLDRMLINGAWAEGSSVISVVHLPRHPSDHAPLKVSFSSRLDNGPRPFRFLNAWTSQPRLLEVIRGAWEPTTQGSPLRVLCSKLLATRRAIQHWNKLHFGNIGSAVNEAEDRLERLEGDTRYGGSNGENEEIHQAQAELNRALTIEEQFWRQKAWVKWLSAGDRNTRYFHAVVKQRRVQGAIHRVKTTAGTWVDRDKDIAREAVEYFSDLFSGSLDFNPGDLGHLIPPIVSTADNALLAEAPDMEEVRRIVFDMDGESAADPDGFTGKFFTFAWDIIAQDVHRAVLSFFCGSELPKFITSTSIVLIPKQANPQDFSKFRPISLCNFFNKVLSRILVGRLASVVSKFISPQQTRFVKGRSITDNYLLAQELIRGIGKKVRGGNVALKLDMTKAYDQMSWGHIIFMLRAFGFGETVIDLVWRLISNVWFSIIINGKSHGFFKSSGGLRQGDPLSPVLFIIGSEMLSRGLNALAFQHIGYRGFPSCPAVTHLAFADDVLIFTNGSAPALKRTMQVLEAYQQSSGQLVNDHKSGYMVHRGTSPARRRVIERITYFTRQEFPIRYLGFPLYTGRCRAAYFGEVCQAVVARIISWKSRMLSQGGRLVLIKHVLSSIPVHLLSAAVCSVSVFKRIEQACANFLWGATGEGKKLHWIRWSQLCLPVEEGGAGFRRLWDVYEAFSCKLWWNFRTGTSLWADYIRAKYCRGLHPCQVELRSSDSPTWRRMLNISRQVEVGMVWMVNGGTCHFWYDNWLGDGGLFIKVPVHQTVTFRDFVINGEWDVQALGQFLPRHLTYQIKHHPVPRGEGQDEVFWSSTASGRFTLASAFDNVHQASAVSVIHGQVWHPQIPLKISFIMLRLLIGKLPITDALWRVGVQLASKCLCCPEGAVELLEHVFSAGKVAMEVWSYFGNICGIARHGSDVRAWMMSWWVSKPRSKRRQVVFTILPVFICWHIWKAQNKAHFEGIQMCVSRVCRDVLIDVKAVVEAQFGQRLELLTMPQLYEWSRHQAPRFRYQVVGWKATAAHLLTLNTDGCSKGNPRVSGGRGILRDAAGSLCFAFSAYFGEASSLRAEALALVTGLRLCGQKGFTNVSIQVDSLVLVGILQRRLLCP
ncbi:uncharacterized protein [Coffea arabica]|uniref:Reverse transcriptase domain-containing protein n=1 Tax=Coffea arabica TaxID=13443 RepID=A0A6P6S4W6_COFAR|nr:uncharacterized protein LOC113687421 [Coffea arabica]